MVRKPIEVGNASQLHDAGMVLLERARGVIASKGEDLEGMVAIGGLLQDFTASGILDPLLAVRPGGKSVAVDVIAEHENGSNLSLYAMENWQSPPSTDVHYHNYWQVLFCVEGSWPDTVWKPVTVNAEGRARDIVVDRHETVGEGTIQALGPTEPHGWVADDIRHTPRATLLMWSGSAHGLPRSVLDIETGEITGEFDFLNPAPGESKAASTASWVRY